MIRYTILIWLTPDISINEEQNLETKQGMEPHQCSTQYSRCKCKQDYVCVHRILVVPGDSGGASTGFVGAFWAIKDRGTSICSLPVENVITDRLSRVCSWWCIMLFLISKNTGINLWPCVIIYTAPRFPIAFCGIQVFRSHISIHDVKSLHRIMLVHYKGCYVIPDYLRRVADT